MGIMLRLGSLSPENGQRRRGGRRDWRVGCKDCPQPGCAGSLYDTEERGPALEPPPAVRPCPRGPGRPEAEGRRPRGHGVGRRSALDRPRG